jgi:hypothetical protein
MTGVEAPLMMAWQACERDEKGEGGKQEGRCCCVLCSPVRELELLDVRSMLGAVRAG